MPFIARRQVFWLIAPALAAVVVLLVLPLVDLLRYSFLSGDFATGEIGELTFANYAKALTDSFVRGVVGRTFGISFAVTLAALVAGLPLAAMIWRAPPFWRSPLTILVLSPLLVSMVASSYGWIVILGNKGIINSFLVSTGLVSSPIKLLYTDLAIGIGLLHVLLPFMVLALVASLDRIDPHLSEAAAVLGANRLQAALTGAQMILTGDAEVVVAGGAESMSSAPYQSPGTRWGSRFGDAVLVDTLKASLTDPFHRGCPLERPSGELGLVSQESSLGNLTANTDRRVRGEAPAEHGNEAGANNADCASGI
jgi:putative spermidine/putrescine transport system permease protein